MNKVKETYGVADELWNRWQQWLENDELWPQHATMIHGDLHPGHIMVDNEVNVTGLIDWTEATHWMNSPIRRELRSNKNCGI